MSEALGLELVVVHVSPRPTLAARATTRERTSRLVERILRWAADVGVPLRAHAVKVRYGRPATKLVAMARSGRADLLVLGGESQPGAVVRAAVRAASCPVFVARELRPRGGIMAATDLRLAATPVVWAAAQLAARENERVSLVHNARSADRRRARAYRASIGQQQLCARLEALDGIVRSADVLADATVTHHPSAARGILDVARARDVDILAIGSRARLGRTLEAVISESTRSLFVVPVDPQRH